MITLLHANPARVREGKLRVDRKFHDGMRQYLTELKMPLVSVHPLATPETERRTMDLVEIPEAELGYRVLALETAKTGYFTPPGLRVLDELITRSRLVYGDGRGANEIAKRRRVPLVAVCEYNLRTELVFAGADAKNALVRTVRQARAFKRYFREIATAMHQAVVVHCNGYPMYHEAGWFSSSRLLYLDSRMRAASVVPMEHLERRLATLGKRRVRMLFSGRLETAKGALDLIEVAAACGEKGLDFEFHLYGQGDQEGAIKAAITSRGFASKISVNEPVTFPRLVELARDFDLFLCCHVQDDPSCTYLESLGCGLPIAGYANAMWRSMCEDSNAGVVSPLGSPAELADRVVRLCGDPNRLATLARRARDFAAQHCFEREFLRRTDSINELWAAGVPRVA